MPEQIILFRGTRPTVPNQREFYYDPETEKLSTVDNGGEWIEREINTTAVVEAMKGVAGGLATLDGSATIPIAQIPDGVGNPTESHIILISELTVI